MCVSNTRAVLLIWGLEVSLVQLVTFNSSMSSKSNDNSVVTK